MTKVDIITASPSQTMTLKLDNGQNLQVTLWYSFNQSGWFYSLVYSGNGYTLNNKRVVNSVNMLRGIRGIVAFGLACSLTDKYEPVFLNDFSSGRASLYILNAEDVAKVEADFQVLKTL